MKTVHEIVREAETNYTQGNVTLGKYVNFSMYDTIERIEAYLNSKHISGDTDSLGREKPFFNIVTAIVNVWYRATDIDRKDLRFVPTKSSSVLLAFVANVLLQRWMDKNRFGQFLNSWGRALARYGSAVVKFVERADELIATVVPWGRLVPDAIDYYAIPRIERVYLTPAQLKERATKKSPNYMHYDMASVNSLIKELQTRKTTDKRQQDNKADFIELYEVSGEMDERLLEDEPDLAIQDEDVKYRQQMHVVSFVKGEKDGEYKDFTVFKGKEKKRKDMITHLIEEDGRTLSIGGVEGSFDAQWMQNHTVKNMKDTLDLVSKLIMQTADPQYAGRNVLNAIETGDIMVHKENMPLTRLANDNPSIMALKSFGDMWHQLVGEITSTPDVIKGNTLPANTPYALGAYLGGNANSLFEIMTENKGLALEDMMREFVIPHLRKQLKNKKEVGAILDDAGIREIDAMYIPVEAQRRYNKRTRENILEGVPPTPFDQTAAEDAIRAELAPLGNKRFFTPDEVGDKMWEEIFSEFEWDSLRVEVTNENVDKQAVLTTLSTVLQTISANPMVLQDPNAKAVFNAILSETGKLSPIQFTPPNPEGQVVPKALTVYKR